MIQLDVLAAGYILRENDVIKEVHSSSTLIRTDDMNVVVDTSSEYYRPVIKASLKQIGILPKDVDVIVLTHSHHDHVSNNCLFPKADVYSRIEENIPGIQVDKDIELCKGVKLVHTPGHTAGSMSVFVEADRRYGIAGDAIPLEENLRKMMPPRMNVDKEASMKSIKTIASYADMIIPGHGFPFLRNI